MKTVIYAVLAAGVLFGNSVSAHPGHAHSGHGHAHKSHKVVHVAPLKRLPVGAVSVVVHGINYWVANDVYYERKGATYVAISAPVGARVKHLPDGAVVVVRNGKQYYRHNGTYYVWIPSVKYYEVVTLNTPQPVPAKRYRSGEILAQLPNGADAVLINGMQYFRFDGLHFLPTLRAGETVYVVVELER